MFYRILFIAFLFVSPFSANSATVTYSGYSLDTETNIVIGGGLEWLQWDESIALSANDALAQYGAGGWRLATLDEIIDLFNSFSFGYTFTSQYQSAAIEPPYTSDENGPTNQFIELFGKTYEQAYEEPLILSSAIFGNINEVNKLRYASVADDYYSSVVGETESRVAFSSKTVYEYSASPQSGIALVRASEVPLPAGVFLFGSAIFGLAGLKRKK